MGWIVKCKSTHCLRSLTTYECESPQDAVTLWNTRQEPVTEALKLAIWLAHQGAKDRDHEWKEERYFYTRIATCENALKQANAKLTDAGPKTP